MNKVVSIVNYWDNDNIKKIYVDNGDGVTFEEIQFDENRNLICYITRNINDYNDKAEFDPLRTKR